MAGISQVWLTEKELEALAVGWDIVQREAPAHITPDMRSGFDKIEMALEPVACRVASS